MTVSDVVFQYVKGHEWSHYMTPRLPQMLVQREVWNRLLEAAEGDIGIFGALAHRVLPQMRKIKLPTKQLEFHMQAPVSATYHFVLHEGTLYLGESPMFAYVPLIDNEIEN